MAASDYEITIGLGGAYISKRKQFDSPTIPKDRMVIDESEILMLVDWFTDREAGKDSIGFSFDSRRRPDCRLELRYVKKNKSKKNE